MALRDAAHRAAVDALNAPPLLAREQGEAIAVTVAAVLGVLRDPAHRDELLAMLLGPDESVRRYGEVQRNATSKVWRVVDDPPPERLSGGAVRVTLVPVSGAERERSGEDDRHG